MSVTKGTRKIGTTIFRTRKVRLSRTYFVEVLCSGSSFRRLGPFETRLHAEDWIRTKSAVWYANNITERDALGAAAK